VKVTDRTKAVRPGGTASVTVRTSKGTRCRITVWYDSGPSEARGLGTKKAGSNGTITWRWMVGTRTHDGTYDVDISCAKGSKEVETTTTFTVR
jgi:hypothetical protein